MIGPEGIEGIDGIDGEAERNCADMVMGGAVVCENVIYSDSRAACAAQAHQNNSGDNMNHRILRRSFWSIGVAVAATLWCAAVPQASAQTYPSRTITLIAPYAAGGDSDLSGRNLAAAAQKFMGQPLIVQNIVGASGTIGSMRVRTAAPDGYTLLIARGGSQAITPALDTKTPYKWNDFTMLSLLELNPVACVVKGDSPYKTLKDLLDALKANPGKLNYATAGPGTTQHMAPEVMFRAAGLPSSVAEPIGYKSGGDATAALLGGQVQFLCNNVPTLGSHVKAGTFRALVASTPERLKEFPDVPTARELGYPQMEQVMAGVASTAHRACCPRW